MATYYDREKALQTVNEKRLAEREAVKKVFDDSEGSAGSRKNGLSNAW